MESWSKDIKFSQEDEPVRGTVATRRDASLTVDLYRGGRRRKSGHEADSLRNPCNTCSRSVRACWWSDEGCKPRDFFKPDADKGPPRFSYCVEFNSVETERIVVPASPRTRTSLGFITENGASVKRSIVRYVTKYISRTFFRNCSEM